MLNFYLCHQRWRRLFFHPCLSVCSMAMFLGFFDNYVDRLRFFVCLFVRVCYCVCVFVRSPPAKTAQPIVLKFSEINVTNPATVPHWSFVKFCRPKRSTKAKRPIWAKFSKILKFHPIDLKFEQGFAFQVSEFNHLLLLRLSWVKGQHRSSGQPKIGQILKSFLKSSIFIRLT